MPLPKILYLPRNVPLPDRLNHSSSSASHDGTLCNHKNGAQTRFGGQGYSPHTHTHIHGGRQKLGTTQIGLLQGGVEGPTNRRNERSPSEKCNVFPFIGVYTFPLQATLQNVTPSMLDNTIYTILFCSSHQPASLLCVIHTHPCPSPGEVALRSS